MSMILEYVEQKAMKPRIYVQLDIHSLFAVRQGVSSGIQRYRDGVVHWPFLDLPVGFLFFPILFSFTTAHYLVLERCCSFFF